MKILMAHDYYLQSGGEDTVFQAERNMLLRAGHDVITYTRHNNDIVHYSLFQKTFLPVKTLWAQDSCRQIEKLINTRRPDIAHFHNTFPLISPGAYYSCQRLGVPVVQTLHNARLICPTATFYRDGRLCEDCMGKAIPWPGVIHGCYRGSRIQTSVVASMLSLHRMLGTWQKQVDVYIASSEFYRTKFVEGGLPPERITIKPHFVSCDPGTRTSAGSYAMFVGRFSREKGALTLMKAWETLKHVPLKIRGEGELTGRLTELMRDNTRKIDLMPRLSAVELTDALKGSRFLVWPSEGYSETFGLVAVEAFACGVPVIGSRLGVMAKVVDDGRTGLHFTAGDAGDLAAKVEWAWNHPEEMESMGRAARAEYEAKYTAERNYKMLMDIYQGVIAAQQSHHPALEPLGARPQDIS